MPRAFLITRRRYDGAANHLDPTEYSGPRSVDYGASDGASECGSESSSSDCPEELYNLTKLAEVSLAAAAGTLVLQQHDERHTGGDDPLRLDAPPYQDRSGEDRDSAGEQEQKDDGASCEEHECPDCGKKYSTSSNLARHRQTHRSLGDKKARRCPHCDKVYVSIPAFSMHVRTHNQGCKCHFCGKCFSRPWLLQGHIRTHTGEKPFKCTICNKAFADKSNLRAHIQTHSNTKPHVCSRCGKAFALKSYLYKHEESSCMRSHNHVVQQQRSESVIVPPPARRISVISPNPEHRPALQPSPKPFDFSDPNRLSAFSRPQPASLNLAVA